MAPRLFRVPTRGGSIAMRENWKWLVIAVLVVGSVWFAVWNLYAMLAE